jgi:hypothetical protein
MENPSHLHEYAGRGTLNVQVWRYGDPRFIQGNTIDGMTERSLAGIIIGSGSKGILQDNVIHNHREWYCRLCCKAPKQFPSVQSGAKAEV